MTNILAIASCRVSSDEQLLNNSLNRQQASVLSAASTLGVTIPEDGWWKESVSSKRGGNLKRKDIAAMLEYCKKHSRVKYLIVDEPDRFMRSIDEAAYFEVMFRQLGVTVWYASDPDLNKGDLASKLLKFTKYLSAEGSNEERQRKSINGQVQALKEGRYPFVPKPGYKKGSVNGLPEIHELRGPILKQILTKVASHLVTPTQALKELNESAFATNRAKYKMDKFRAILTDPFYAGILEINKQVKYRNENGLHEPLITKEQHYELVRIMSNKPKNQNGPRKNGNQKFPLNNILYCDDCKDSGGISKFVGFEHTNGKTSKIYMRYRCRTKGCGKYIHASDIHESVEQLFNAAPMTQPAKQDLLEALEIVWKEQEAQSVQTITRLRHKIRTLKESIANQIEALSDPKNSILVDEIRASIATKKAEVLELEERVNDIETTSNSDRERFVDFSLNYVDDLATHFFELPEEKRLLCKQLVFPGGFRVNKNKIVYTPEKSELYRLATKQKDLSNHEKSFMVRVKRL
jgi:DNA invertase Pin-like site-specific DNA recombinase